MDWVAVYFRNIPGLSNKYDSNLELVYISKKVFWLTVANL